jgi:hypothetical protein
VTFFDLLIAVFGFLLLLLLFTVLRPLNRKRGGAQQKGTLDFTKEKKRRVRVFGENGVFPFSRFGDRR